MVAGELLVDLAVGLAELDGVVATVAVGLFLLDDVGVEGRRQVVGLAGEIGAGVVIHAVFLELGVAQIGPEYGHHAQLMGAGEGLGDLHDLAS